MLWHDNLKSENLHVIGNNNKEIRAENIEIAILIAKPTSKNL